MKKTLLAVSLALASFAAAAADYYVVVPSAAKARAAANQISVTLNSATLPAGKINSPYTGFDLNSALQVNGDSSFNPAGVLWSIASGSLPTGLSLSSSGVIAGTPTVAVSDQAFEAKASYKGSFAKRIYALTVNPLASCATPWGETLDSGTTYGTQVYASSTVNYPASCSDTLASLSCSDGELSVPNPSKTCTVKDADWNSVVSLLKFDGSWTDAKGNSVTPSGTATLSSSAKFGSGGANFGLSQATFGTDGGKLTMARGPFQFGSADFTIEAFIKPNNTITNGQLAGLHRNGVSNDWLFYYNMGKLVFMWGAPTITSTNAPMSTGVWHHVAATRSGSTINLWLDGNKVGTGTITGAIPNATSWPMTIGSDESTYLNFQGGLDSMRITVGKARYTSNFTVPATDFPSQ